MEQEDIFVNLLKTIGGNEGVRLAQPTITDSQNQANVNQLQKSKSFQAQNQNDLLDMEFGNDKQKDTSGYQVMLTKDEIEDLVSKRVQTIVSESTRNLAKSLLPVLSELVQKVRKIESDQISISSSFDSMLQPMTQKLQDSVKQQFLESKLQLDQRFSQVEQGIQKSSDANNLAGVNQKLERITTVLSPLARTQKEIEDLKKQVESLNADLSYKLSNITASNTFPRQSEAQSQISNQSGALQQPSKQVEREQQQVIEPKPSNFTQYQQQSTELPSQQQFDTPAPIQTHQQSLVPYQAPQQPSQQQPQPPEPQPQIQPQLSTQPQYQSQTGLQQPPYPQQTNQIQSQPSFQGQQPFYQQQQPLPTAQQYQPTPPPQPKSSIRISESNQPQSQPQPPPNQPVPYQPGPQYSQYPPSSYEYNQPQMFRPTQMQEGPPPPQYNRMENKQLLPPPPTPQTFSQPGRSAPYYQQQMSRQQSYGHQGPDSYGRPQGHGGGFPPQPQAGPSSSGQGRQGGGSVTIDKVVYDISQMGFRPNDVRQEVFSMLQQGEEVDLNKVIDRLTLKGKGL